MESPQELRDIRDHAHAVRRRWPWVLAPALLVGLAAALVTVATPQEFSASVELLVESAGQADAERPVEAGVVERALLGSSDLTTRQQLITSQEVAGRVAAELDLPDDPAALRRLSDRIEVSPVDDTNIFELTASHTDPEIAAALPRVFAEQFLQHRREVVAERVDAAFREVDDLAASTRTQLDSVREQIATATPEEAEELTDERDRLLERLRQLEEQRIQLQVADELVVTGQIIRPAVVPDPPATFLRAVRGGVLGLAVGLVLGLGLALVRDWLGDELWEEGGVERAVDAPVLATVLPGSGGPSTPARERYRTLAAALAGALDLRDRTRDRSAPAVIVVADVAATRAAPQVAAGLAGALARRGLAAGLAGTVEADVPAAPVAVRRLAVDGDLDPAALGGLLREAQGVDVIVVAVPAVLERADAQDVAAQVSGVLLAVGLEHTRRSEALQAAKEIRQSLGRLLGAVAVEPPAGRPALARHGSGDSKVVDPVSGRRPVGVDGR